MSVNYYKETLEALNMKKKKQFIHNKLNTVFIHSDDERLKALTKEAMDGLKQSSTNTEITPLIEFNYVNTDSLQKLCKIKLRGPNTL